MKYLIGILTLLVTACSTQPDSDVNPDIIPLDGPWEFATDHRDRGIEGQWYNRTLEDTITLPGTTDLRQKDFSTTIPRPLTSIASTHTRGQPGTGERLSYPTFPGQTHFPAPGTHQKFPVMD